MTSATRKKTGKRFRASGRTFLRHKKEKRLHLLFPLITLNHGIKILYAYEVVDLTCILT